MVVMEQQLTLVAVAAVVLGALVVTDHLQEEDWVVLVFNFRQHLEIQYQ
jgi:hypothetical protein